VIEIKSARSDAEASVYLAMSPKIWPGAPTLEEFRHRESTCAAFHPLAYLDGEPAGMGHAAVFPGTEKDPYLACGFGVVPALRRRGVGTALHRAISEDARARGKDGLQLEVMADDPGSLEWIVRREFVEVERQEAVALSLEKHEPASVDPPSGVEIVTRAERPDLARQMYDVGVAAARDIPGLDGENDPGFESWAAFEIERPSRDPELCFIALADGRVVGFASLDVFPEDVFHGLTAVAREWRGRGIGTALKRAQIAAAKKRGFARLLTESQLENEPMRRLNEKLGFLPEPSMSTIVLRGPLAA
jgi:mycothiol synthase